MQEFDYIVIGAGSAGCVLAERLSRDSRHTVLVVEAGGSDRRAWIRLPIGYGRTFFDARVNWKYQTEPEPACNGRSGYWPRGKVIGGSSSINALVWCRGLPRDFEDWQAAGADGWGWEDVRPHFERIECRVAADGTTSGQGPQYVTDVAARTHPSNRHYFAAAREIGLPFSEDFNGPAPEGVGYYRITTRNGIRCSAADAFLRPALGRPNLRLLTDTLAERLLFDGRRATGVRLRTASGGVEVRARREVILSAGAVNTPQLLQLSGIGPGELLQQHGIPVIAHNPAVGANLQDHLAITYYYRATEPTMNNELAPWWGKLWAGMKYVLARRGPLSLSVNQCGGFVRSSPRAAHPDLQLYFNPMTYTTAPSDRRPLVNPDPFPGFLISFQPARPASRGRIEIRSPDPLVAPSIRPDYLSVAGDIADIVAGGRLLQALVRTAALQRLIAAPIAPDLLALDDEGLVEDFRARAATVFHPVSSCAMGAALDARLRVSGVEGLRVVDASAFPNITSGNTNAPTLMLADKAADAILESA